MRRAHHRALGASPQVYYRSDGSFADHATHYFVMTAQLESLLSFGAVRTADGGGGGGPYAAHNIDAAELEAYARRAIRAFVPALSSRPLVDGSMQLFDFSERRQSSVAAAIARDASEYNASGSREMLVTRVGDALQVGPACEE